MSLLGLTNKFNFFKNKEMNYIYIAIFIISFGESLISVFIPIYFMQIGLQIYEVFLYYFLVSLYFVIFAYFGAKLTSKIGDKHSIIISTVCLLFYNLGLIFVEKYMFLILLLPILLAFKMMLFNYGYHLNFLNHSDKKHVGKELAFIGVIVLIAVTFAPYIGSILADFNFILLFSVSSIFIFIGIIPLFLSKDKFEDLTFSFHSLFSNITSKKNIKNLISFSGYAIDSTIGSVVWPIFIIMIIGTIKKTGLLITVSMLISLFVFAILGKLIDNTSKIKILKLGTFLYFFAWIARIFANSASKILFVDSYKNVSEKILHLSWGAHSYDLAQRTKYFEFIVGREIAFNIARVIIYPILMLIFWVNFHPFTLTFILASIASIGYAFIEK